MYTVLTGAKINMGDFLITDCAKKLLSALRPEHDHFQLPAWKPLDKHLDAINSSAAVIILGGPGFQPSFYPGVYKFTKDLSKIKVPIIPMGLGWKGFPGDFATLKRYRFDKTSQTALRRISSEATWIGCRDYLTLEMLRRNGIENALMTGCPAWYDFESIGRIFKGPKAIKELVFTPAQRHVYRDQSVAVMKSIRELFADAKLYCSFNRGIDGDSNLIPESDRKNNRWLSAEAKKLGFNVVDTSFGLDKIEFYDNCDLHVGYRVHSHLYFLSKRRPSFLLHEDGRGRGVSSTLNLQGIDAFRAPGKLGALTIRPDDDAPEILACFIREETENGFARYSGVHNVIDAHYEIMKKFISSLPG